MSPLVTPLIVAAAISFGVALAWVPMQVVVSQMSRNVKQFIERQRERRIQPRETPDRRRP